MSRSGVIAIIFIIIFVFMSFLSFFVPTWVELGTVSLVIAFLVVGLALATVLSVIIVRQIKATVQPVPTEPGRPAAPPSAVDERAVQVLSILQKKGRLIDFLEEDISGYQDSQIGAAVRNIHKGCREALAEYIALKPVLKETEGATVSVEKGFDPSAIRLTGNVVGTPPFKGKLTHSGWKVVKTNLPPIPENQDASIVEPAEVEI